MKGTIKKIVSVVLAIAMVVTSISYTPDTVSAASGWTEITGVKYQSDLSAMTLNYKVAKGSESMAVAKDGDFYLLLRPENFSSETDYSVYMDEGKTTTGTTQYKGDGRKDGYQYIMGFGLTSAGIKANTYYSVRLVYGEYDVVYYFYTGDAADITDEEDTTKTVGEGETDAETDATTTTASQQVSAPGKVTDLIRPSSDSLPYYFAWAAATGAVSYNFYVNGELVANTTTNAYDAANYFESASGNFFVISVKAVNSAGAEGEAATIEYSVASSTTYNSMVLYDYRNGHYTAKNGNLFYIESSVISKFTGDAGCYGVFDGTSGSKPAYNYSGSIMDGTPVFSVISGNGVSTITIDGTTYSTSETEEDRDGVYRGNDCLFIDQTIFNLPEGTSKKVFNITLNGNATPGTDFSFDVTVVDPTAYVTSPTTLSVQSYGKYTGRYFPIFSGDSNASSYNIYVNGTFITNIKGSGYYITNSQLLAAGVTDGDYTLEVESVDSAGNKSLTTASSSISVRGTSVEKAPNDDIPQVYIYTNGNGITKDYFSTANVAVSVIDTTGKTSDFVSTSSNIKIRGNSTAGADKKAYNIKFGTKTNLLGIDSSGNKSKKWSFLANAYDKSLVRNALVMKMAQEMGIQYTSEFQFVDIYLNGSYKGSYLAIESVEAGNGRVEVDSDNTSSADALFELAQSTVEDYSVLHITTDLDVKLVYNDPEIASSGDDLTTYATKIASDKSIISRFEEQLKNSDYEGISQYADMDTFAKFYILNEFFGNQDFNYSSTRFYIKDGKLYAGPPWDFDLSSGNLGSFYGSSEGMNSVTMLNCQNMTWYNYLLRNQQFRDLIQKYYEQYKSTFKSIYTTYLDELLETYGNSFNRNYTSTDNLGAGWSATQKDTADGYSYANAEVWTSYQDTIDYLVEWLTQRDAYLSEQWEVEDETAAARLTYNDGVVTAKWNYTDEATPESFTLSYTAIDVASGNTTEKTITGIDGTATSYELTDTLANDTNFTVVAVYADGETKTVGETTALCDIKITSTYFTDYTTGDVVESPIEGEKVKINHVITNIGTAATDSTAFNLTVYIDGTYNGYVTNGQMVAPGDTYTNRFTNTWTVVSGTHTIKSARENSGGIVLPQKSYDNDTIIKSYTFDKTVVRPNGVTAIVTDNVPYITFTAATSDDAANYVYDIYVDDVYNTTVSAPGTYPIENLSAGEHKITVYSKYNNEQSIGVSVYATLEEVTTTPEKITEEATTLAEGYWNKTLVAFDYDNTSATAGGDLTGYTPDDSESDYYYKATTGTGVFTASTTGAALKHIEWSKEAYTDSLGNNYGYMTVIKASKSNLWSADAYAKFEFSTEGFTEAGYNDVTLSFDMAATSSGPADYKVVYYDNDNTEKTLGTITITDSKVATTYRYSLPEELLDQNTVAVYIKLADTTAVDGTDIAGTKDGYWGINNFRLTAVTNEETTTVEETQTTETTETATEEPSEYKNSIVEFKYAKVGTSDDVEEYAYPDNDYLYYASSGTGTMEASVNGDNAKHLEWVTGKYTDVSTGTVVDTPTFGASDKSPNYWTADAYAKYTFSTKGYEQLSASIQLGATNKGPKNISIGYYDGDNFQTITTTTIASNKKLYTVDFDLPEALLDQDSVSVYVKLTDTVNLSGSDMTSDAYRTGGELAINNFVVYKTEDTSSSLVANPYNIKSDVSSTSATITWNTAEGLKSNIYVYNEEGTTLIDSAENITDNQLSLSNLAKNTTYHVVINATDETTTTNNIEFNITTPLLYTNSIVEFKYDGNLGVSGDDVIEYTTEEDDYTYFASAGVGTMTASVNGTDQKHLEWKKSGAYADYSGMIPVVAASSKNVWSADAYVAYTFSTAAYSGKTLSGSVTIGATKTGPKNYVIGYYDSDNNFTTITTKTLSTNKKAYVAEFTLPDELVGQDNVTIYVKLADTTDFSGSDITGTATGEFAINDFVITYEQKEEIVLPENLAAVKATTTLNGDGTSTINVTWNELSSDVELYKDDVVVDSQSEVTSYTYTTAEQSCTYVVQVKTHDTTNNMIIPVTVSTDSNAVEVTKSSKNNKVSASWPEMTGATAYKVTYTPYTASASPIMLLALDDEDDSTESVIISDGSTSYNFTEAGINLADGTNVSVSYTTDTDLDTATYALIAEQEVNSDVSVSVAEPVVDSDNMTATVGVTATNNGTAVAENVVVSIVDGDTLKGSAIIGDLIAGGSNTGTITITETTAGTYTYNVVTSDGTVVGTVSYTIEDNSKVQQPNIAIPDADATTWVPFDSRDNKSYKSVYDTYYYVASETIRSTVSTNTGMTGLYDGTSRIPGWGYTIAAGTPTLSFVCGNGATSVVIDGVEYTSDNVNVAISGDCIHIAQSLFQLAEGESYHIFKVTLNGITHDGVENYTFALKVEGEKAPSYTKVTYPDTTDMDLWRKANPTETESGLEFYMPLSIWEADTIVNNGEKFGSYTELSKVPYNGTAGNISTAVLNFFVKSAAIPATVWIDDTKISKDTLLFVRNDSISMSEDVFNLGGAKEKVFIVTLRTSSAVDYSIPILVINTNVETTTVEPTTVEPTTAEQVTAPEGAVWEKFITNNNEYYFYDPDDRNVVATNIEGGTTLYFGLTPVPVSAAINGEAKEFNIQSDQFRIPIDYVAENGIYQLDITGSDGAVYTIYIKHESPKNYAPTSFAAAVGTTGTVTASWETSSDADDAAATYEVKVDDTVATVTENTATATVSEYKTYTVTLTTIVDGEVVNTQTTEVTYKDPEAVDSEVTITQDWERRRRERATWTAVDNATGYAIYVDGELYTTLESDVLTYDIPAYAFANSTNDLGQPTTAGKHTTAIVALFNDSEAEEKLENVNSKNIMKQNEFTLYVNYVFGNKTDIWNEYSNSPWNFTICEQPDGNATGITTGASAKVEYTEDGLANVTFDNMGVHSGGDQEWTIKAAIYDEPIEVGEELNLSFDIYGSAALIGQSIVIKCVPEEVYESGEYANVAETGYEEATYTFVSDGNGGAVLHYSNSFTSTNTTYDLLFGLGLLDFSEADSSTLTFTDPSIVETYGVQDVNANGIYNSTEPDNSSLYITYSSNVPTEIEGGYTYNAYIYDGEGTLIKTLSSSDEEPFKSGYTVTGLSVGTYTVKVESVYDGTVTSSVETSATIAKTETALPDLVVSDITISNPTMDVYRVGDTITVTLTIKNIGDATASAADGKITTHLVGALSGNTPVYLYTYDNGMGDLAVGETYTFSKTYTLKSSNVGRFRIGGKADADSEIIESDETNNLTYKTINVYEALKEVTLTNDGKDVKAAWDKVDGITQYIVSYTSNGETKTYTVATNSFTFPEDAYADNNTKVTVYQVNSDDSRIAIAQGTALADIVLDSIKFGTSGTADSDTAVVGANNRIYVSVKNQGTAYAVVENNNYTNMISVDTISNSYSLTTLPQLNPNASSDYIAVGATWKPTTEGEYELTYNVNERRSVSESNTDNNRGTVSVKAKEKEVEAPDLVITSISTPKNSYAVGDKIPVTLTMKNIGNAAATTTGNFTMKVRRNGTSATYDFGQNWYVVGSNYTLNAGEEVTGTVNYTVTQEDYDNGFITFYGVANGDSNLNEAESNTDNNYSEPLVIKVIDKGTINLAYNEAEGENAAYVSATWTQPATATGISGYKLVYVSNGATNILTIDSSMVTTTSDNDGNITYVYNFPSDVPLDNKSYVTVMATYDTTITAESVYYEYATEQALPDLIVTKVTTDDETLANIGFNVYVTIKNVGTAQIAAVTPPADGDQDDWAKKYPYALVCTLQGQTNIEAVQGPEYYGGVKIGESYDTTLTNVVASEVGAYTLTVKADDPNFSDASSRGFYDELDDTNNTGTVQVQINVNQEPMDWTPLRTSRTDDTPWIFNIGATDSIIEYKVLDTTIKDIGYSDIFSNYSGYTQQHFNLAISSSKYNMFPVEYDYDDNGKVIDNTEKSTSTIYFAQVSSDYCNSYSDTLGSEVVSTGKLLATQAVDIVDADGNILQAKQNGSTPLGYVGNGINYMVSAWGLGKYYVMVMQNAKGDNITVAFRVTTGTGKWIRTSSTQSTTDPDKLPFYYHRGYDDVDEDGKLDTSVDTDARYNETTGTLYYDASDMGLSSITCYNGDHLTVVLDSAYSLPVADGAPISTFIDSEGEEQVAWKVEVAYASVGKDSSTGEVTVEDPGDDADWVVWNGQQAGGRTIGNDGTNAIQIGLPSFLQELPVHSDQGGVRDDEYYFIRIYYNQRDHEGDYVSIPVRVSADIPQIEEPQNLDVTAGSKHMTVSFSETTLQTQREYYYTINIYSGIGDNKSETPIASSVSSSTTALHHPDGVSEITEGGSYTFDVDGLTTVGSEYTVEVVTEWCEQKVVSTYEYTVEELEAGNVEVLGFQINSNTDENGVSEFAPSFRTVSRAAKQIANADGEICGVVGFGTIYAIGKQSKSDMTLSNCTTDGNIRNLKASGAGEYTGYSTNKYDDSNQNYFAMTLKPIAYNYDNLIADYTYRAYAVLDDGSIVYSDNCYTVSEYEIAEYLYENQMMPTKAGHEFLYNNILNIVSLHDNANEIANAMIKATGIASPADPLYNTINGVYNEILWYTKCTNNYVYANHDGTFNIRRISDEAQAALLESLNKKTNTDYENIYEWIKNEAHNMARNNGVHYKGCYTELAYDWDSNIYKDFDTE